MREDSLTKFCISACVFMVFISLSMNFVVGLGVFDTKVPENMINQNYEDATTVGEFDITSLLGGSLINTLSNPLGIIALLGLAGLAAASLISGNYTAVGVYLFSFIFWLSWKTNFDMLSTLGYLDSTSVMSIFLIISVAMAFIFAAAVVGMLGGND